ncbi:MAG: EAL domain-containing protein [Actinomycetota bacterium]
MRRIDRVAVLTLALGLALTAMVTAWRSEAVTSAETDAIDVAEEHFLAIVDSVDFRTLALANEIEISMRAVAASNPVDNDTVLGRLLARYEVVEQPGFKGAAFSRDGEVLVATDGWPAPLREALAASEGSLPNEPSTTLSSEGVLVTMATRNGVLGYWFEADGFLIDDERDGYPVRSSLVFAGAPAAGHTELDAAAPSHSHDHADDHGHAGGERESHGHETWRPADLDGDNLHFHAGTIAHDHNNLSTFASTAHFDLLGAHWHLTLETSEGFVEIPTSQEVPIVAISGGVISLGLFLLVRSLRRERDEANRRSAARAERFAVGFSESPIGVLELTHDLVVVSANRAASVLLDRPAPTLVDHRLQTLLTEDSQVHAEDHIRAVLVGDTPTARSHRREVQLSGPGGSPGPWVQITPAAISHEDGGAGVLLQLTDVTEQRRANAELQQRALHDALTGLPNRALLLDRLEHALAHAARSQTCTAALFIDVDGFKQVNDSLGHGSGDMLLQEVATRIQASARTDDTVARFGGDEFVVLCEALASPTDAVELAERVRQSLTRPIQLAGTPITVTMSVGVAVARAGDSAEAVIRDADLALYEAKSQGRNRSVMFAPAMRAELLERIDRETALQAAADRGEFAVHFQPLLDLRTDVVVGFEALIRWHHQLEGLVLPADFLPSAAQLGLLPELDRFVLRSALRHTRLWSETLGRTLTVAVNASSATITDPTFPDAIGTSLALEGVDPHQLIIEITEQDVVDVHQATPVIQRIRSLGVQVAIDDFGTGQSSFAQIASLDFDILKIDRSFVQHAETPRGAQIVRTLVEMGDAMAVAMVAEGVETAADLERVRAMGCTVAQGFHIGEPASSDAVMASLLAST